MDNINLQTKKIFLYARKSTDEPERQVLSIEAQMFELREYAKKENLNIVREFVESKTAKEPGREIFNDMITNIKKKQTKKNFPCVVVSNQKVGNFSVVILPVSTR